MQGIIPDAVKQLIEMGFDQELSALAYKNNPQQNDLDVLINWIGQEQDRREQQSKQPQNEVSKDQSQKMQEEQPQAETQAITKFINEELAKQLMDMGYSKFVSEKSLFFTQQKQSIEAALEWIEQNKTAPDFEEELRVVGQEETKKLTPQEAKEQATKLLKELREKKKQEEEKLEKEREISRMQNGKMLAEAKRLYEEQELIRLAQQRKKEKEEERIDRMKMEEQLRKDKEERFGKKAGSGSNSANIQQKIPEQTPIQKFETAIKQIIIASPPDLIDDKAKNCITLIKAYLSNILKNPTEQKFQKIRRENAAFKTRVEETFGGVPALNAAGFQDDGNGYLVLTKFDQFYIEDCVKIVDNCVIKLLGGY